MSVTMNSDLSNFQIQCDSVASIKNQFEAKDVLGKIFGALYWAPRFKKPGYKKRISVLKKARRLIIKNIDNLPERTDKHDNIMTSDFCCDYERFYPFCVQLGAKESIWDNGLTSVCVGKDIAITYCEGDVMIYKGPNANKAANEAVHFWLNDA